MIEPQSELLTEIAQLPIDRRLQEVLRMGKQSFELVTKNTHCAPAQHDRFAFDRLAWAVAFNVSATEEACSTIPAECACYVTRFGSNPTLAALLAELASVRRDGGTLLADLALSTGCEHRMDWQPPGCRSFDQRSAAAYMAFVEQSIMGQVRRFLHSKFNCSDETVRTLADTAWSDAFKTYWSTAARRRFLGLSRIASLVGQIAFAAGRKQRCAAQKTVSLDDTDEERQALVKRVGVIHDPSNALIKHEFWEALTGAIRQLKDRQAVVAEMVWLRGIPAVETARILGVTEAAVSQHLSKARIPVQKELAVKGFQA